MKEREGSEREGSERERDYSNNTAGLRGISLHEIMYTILTDILFRSLLKSKIFNTSYSSCKQISIIRCLVQPISSSTCLSSWHYLMLAEVVYGGLALA